MGLERFHESIGSMALADDFARFDDRAIVEELQKCLFRMNPGTKTDASALAADKFSTNDLRLIGEQLSILNTPKFPGSNKWHGLVSVRMMRHLREDPLFQQFAIALIQSGQQQAMTASTLMIGGTGSGGQVATGMGPMRNAAEEVPYVYEDFVLFPSNTLPTRLVATNSGNLLAHLGYFLGPQSVGLAGGGAGPRVYANDNTDYKRHWFYIWRMFGQYEYLLEDNEFSGCCVEARTYAP
jgi:hypothetical protein